MQPNTCVAMQNMLLSALQAAGALHAAAEFEMTPYLAQQNQCTHPQSTPDDWH